MSLLPDTLILWEWFSSLVICGDMALAILLARLCSLDSAILGDCDVVWLMAAKLPLLTDEVENDF